MLLESVLDWNPAHGNVIVKDHFHETGRDYGTQSENGGGVSWRVRLPAAILLLLGGSTPTANAAEFDSARLAKADQAILASIEQGEIPGAVLLVGRGSDILYRKAYGSRALQPEKVPMTTDTIFDLASISKVVGAATSLMLLSERGQIKFSEKVSHYIPSFGVNGKSDVTIEQLLLHRSGLIADNPLEDYAGGPAEGLKTVYALTTAYPPGTKFVYSDVGYIVLGELVRVVSGRPLDRFAREEIFEPLGMKETGYLPPASWKLRCAPTEQREGRWMVGEVHDPRAYLLGGVAGDAGLFSTADDLARYCQMILAGGTLDGKRIMSPETVEQMTTARCLPNGGKCRGYGWDIDTGYASPRGEHAPKRRNFGHTGYTGTLFWLDPTHDCYMILLTNFVHPKDPITGHKPIEALRRAVSSAVAEAILPPGSIAPAADKGRGSVLCGIDVLKRDGLKLLAGKRVALITNHTGRDADGNRTVDLLAKAANVKLVKLFSPEHGLYGALDEKVDHTVDKTTGLKVYSLYGETRRPTSEMLDGVDTLVFDIQDIGARFYTYPATMGNAMEEAAKRKIQMVVLDRPNPITGTTVDGPLADANKLGFTAYMRLPVVHGMTVGELARMFNSENKIGCDLHVVAMEGWKRSMWWDETGLMWINPSPNMRNLTQALLYPAVCLLEATNVSVGRGTDQPFEVFGAEWIDGRKLAAALNDARLPGLRFVPIEFTPNARQYSGKACQGVYIIVTDRNAVQPVRSGLTMAWCLNKLFGEKFQLGKVINLLANADTLAAVRKTEDPATLTQMWKDNLDEFKKMREKYLIYK